MAVDPYCVYIVVDREYGSRLVELQGPVWIVDTPTNRAAAKACWKENPDNNHLTGITLYTALEKNTAEDLMVHLLDTVELHHGGYSADPPFTVLQAIGTQLTKSIEAEIAQFGFDSFQSTADGFRAVRSLASANDLAPR